MSWQTHKTGVGAGRTSSFLSPFNQFVFFLTSSSSSVVLLFSPASLSSRDSWESVSPSLHPLPMVSIGLPTMLLLIGGSFLCEEGGWMIDSIFTSSNVLVLRRMGTLSSCLAICTPWGSDLLNPFVLSLGTWGWCIPRVGMFVAVSDNSSACLTDAAGGRNANWLKGDKKLDVLPAPTPVLCVCQLMVRFQCYEPWRQLLTG